MKTRIKKKAGMLGVAVLLLCGSGMASGTLHFCNMTKNKLRLYLYSPSGKWLDSIDPLTCGMPHPWNYYNTDGYPYFDIQYDHVIHGTHYWDDIGTGGVHVDGRASTSKLWLLATRDTGAHFQFFYNAARFPNEHIFRLTDSAVIDVMPGD